MKKTIALGLFLVALTAQAQTQVGRESIDNPDPGSVVPAGTGPEWLRLGAQLYANGTFQSAATGGGPAGTSPVSVLTPPDTTLGSTCNTATFRLSDDFTVPAGGNWTVTGVTVFGYQTQAAPGGSTVSTMTSGVVRIWNGPPNVVGSTVVFGDVTTNRLTTTSFSTVWRVSNTTLTNLQRPMMAVEMGGFSTNLAPGTYWLEWGIGGSTPSGPFCPPNTSTAATNNALQFNVGTAAWAPANDGGSMRRLDFPFIIEGTTAAPNITATVPAGAVNLGNVAPSAPISSVFGFTNSATATASGTVSCALTGAPAGFAVAPAGVQTVAIGATQNFTVTGTAPAAIGAFSGGTLTCTVQGIAAPVVYTLNGAVVAAPAITPTVAAGAVNLGSVPVGSTISRSFGFTNAASASGSGTVSCALTGAPAGFAVAPTTVQTVAPGATTTFTVTGPVPTTLGSFSGGTLTCTVQGVAAPVVYTINGTVVAPVAVPTLSQLGLLIAALSLLIGGMLMARRYG